MNICLKTRGLLATLLTAPALLVQPLAAQAPDEDVVIEESVDPALEPLTPREERQAVGALERDLGVGAQRVEVVSVDRHEEDDERSADVVLYNYDTEETIAAVVSLEPRPVVAEVAVTPEQAPGLGPEEVEQAQQLALADPTVQAELSAIGVTEGELIITHIRFQTELADDPCSTDRCVLLFFNTADAALDLQPLVNLTTAEVALQ
jgi:Cu2+-containing amine oxidase